MAGGQMRIDGCRLVVVTGKGGVGKTTVAAALTVALADAGRDTIAAELSGQARIPALLGSTTAAAPGTECELAPGTWATTIDPEPALVEWAGRIVRPRPLLEVAIRSKAFSGFLAAAPGARELVSITKACELSALDRWSTGAASHDVALLDAPATGHGLGMLATPTTYAEIARVGPVAGQAREVAALLGDPARCLIVIVATAEETPVSEASELAGKLEQELGRGPSLVVANVVTTDRFSDAEAGLASERLPGSVAVAAIERGRRLAERQARHLERLEAGCDAPLLVLPDLGSAGVGAEGVETLSEIVSTTLRTG